MLKSVLASAALCADLGATAAFADASALDKFTGAKAAIMSYYAANAREGANCGASHGIQPIRHGRRSIGSWRPRCSRRQPRCWPRRHCDDGRS